MGKVQRPSKGTRKSELSRVEPSGRCLEWNGSNCKSFKSKREALKPMSEDMVYSQMKI